MEVHATYGEIQIFKSLSEKANMGMAAVPDNCDVNI